MESISHKYVYIEYDDDSLYRFINPEDNDELSKMSGSDLKELISLLDKYQISLLSRIGFDESFTFGIEIEFEYAFLKSKINQLLKNEFPGGEWHTHYDGSLSFGAEISSPRLIDSEETWKEIDKVCSIAKKYSKVGKRAGGHIHVGSHCLGADASSWFNFIKLWSTYENIIFRFGYGDHSSARPGLLNFAKPMSNEFWFYQNINRERRFGTIDMMDSLSRERYQSVNLKYATMRDDIMSGSTIEFRCPNGTLDSAIWQNNVGLFLYLLSYAKDESFDDDILNRRHELNKDIYGKMDFYNEIYLEQALEFCDLIYDINLYKINFLKQYLKDFQVNNQYSRVRGLTR